MLGSLLLAVAYQPALRSVGSRAARPAPLAARAAPVWAVVAAPSELQATARLQMPMVSAETLPLRIDGEWYDVGPWADDHPGGRWLLEYARGRDVTALFHAIHMRSQAASAVALARLPRLEASAVALPSAPGLSPSELLAEGGRLQGEYVFSLDEPPDAPAA